GGLLSGDDLSVYESLVCALPRLAVSRRRYFQLCAKGCTSFVICHLNRQNRLRKQRQKQGGGSSTVTHIPHCQRIDTCSGCVTWSEPDLVAILRKSSRSQPRIGLSACSIKHNGVVDARDGWLLDDLWRWQRQIQYSQICACRVGAA